MFGEFMDSLKNTDTSRLLERIRESDRADEAFEELLLEYMPLINKRVSCIGIPQADFPEATQEARVALHSAALGYDAKRCEGVTFGLYASVCISNRLTSYLRARARRGERTDEFSAPEDLGSAVDVESAVAARDSFDRVMRAARELLSEFEFRVLCLSVEGYSVADIAAKLSVVPKSVENARFRLRRRLTADKEICEILSQF